MTTENTGLSPRNTRREFLGAMGRAAAFSALAGRAWSAPSSTRKPNIVVIYTDDQDFDEIACYSGKMPTPHMDSLARDGIRFTRFYVSSALCSPSRYGALTGRYASRRPDVLKETPPNTPVRVTQNDALIITDERYTLASVLRENGYRTGMCGKWHQGTTTPIIRFKDDDDPADPAVAKALADNYANVVAAVKKWGFDYADGVYMGNRQTGQEPWLPESIRKHNMEWVTAAANRFIEQNKDTPFFLFFAPTLVHDSAVDSLEADIRSTPLGFVDVPPLQPRASVLERAAACSQGDEKAREKAAASIWLDDGVGAILDQLTKLGLDKNTLVILASDNANISKMTCYDGGARTPCLARWPGFIPPGAVSDALISNVDFAPTAFEIAGIAPPSDMVMDGQSIVKALRNDPAYERDSLFLEIGYDRAVVGRDWKYIARRGQSQNSAQRADTKTKQNNAPTARKRANFSAKAAKEYPNFADRDQLYFLKDDPSEQRNLYDDPAHKETRETMRAQMRSFCKTLPYSFAEFASQESE